MSERSVRFETRLSWFMALATATAVTAGALLTAPAAGWARTDVAGSGKHKEDRRKIGGFDKVEIGGALEVQIEAGGAGSEIVVAGDDNLVPLVRTEVKDGQLNIRTEESLRPKAGLTITVRVPSLRAVEARGAVRVTARGLTGDRLVVEVAGASRVDLEGRVKKLEAELSGASRLGAETLKAETVRVQAAGASSAAVNAKAEVRGQASGASNVQIHGAPATVKVETSGASTVTRKS